MAALHQWLCAALCPQQLKWVLGPQVGMEGCPNAVAPGDPPVQFVLPVPPC